MSLLHMRGGRIVQQSRRASLAIPPALGLRRKSSGSWGCLVLPQSDDTALRNLRKSAVIRPVEDPKVVGIDDWAWLKGRR